jgi:hypothetical protein
MTGTTARIGGVLALAALLAACQPQGGGKRSAAAPAAPQNACMEIMSPPGTKPGKLRAVAYDTPNLDQCGEYLEGLRIERNGKAVWGLWNGVYIYADAKGIDSAASLGAARYAIYSPEQRQQIDLSLQQQVAAAASSKPATPQP